MPLIPSYPTIEHFPRKSFRKICNQNRNDIKSKALKAYIIFDKKPDQNLVRLQPIKCLKQTLTFQQPGQGKKAFNKLVNNFIESSKRD